MFELAVVAALILAIMALVRSQDGSSEIKALRQRLDELERAQRDKSGGGYQARQDLTKASSSPPPISESPSGADPVTANESPGPAPTPGQKLSSEASPSPDIPTHATPTPSSEKQDVPSHSGLETPEDFKPLRPLAPLPASMRTSASKKMMRGEDDDPLPVVGRATPSGGAEWEGEERQVESEGFEARFGSTWLLRIGLVFLVIAAALFGIVVTPRIGPAGKVGVGYLFAALVFGAGLISHRLSTFARPVMAGGLSLAFLVSYAAYFVEPMRCVNPAVSLSLMGFFIVAILMSADRWRSEFTGGLAVFLGHVGAFVAARNLESATPSSLVAILFLSTAAVVLLLRRSWIVLSLFAVTAAYGSHLLWTSLAGEAAQPRQALYVNLAFLSSYYTIFTLSDLLWWRRNPTRSIEEFDRDADENPEDSSPALGMALGPLNLVLFTSLASLIFLRTEIQFGNIHVFFFILALVQGVLGVLHRNVGNRNFSFYPAAATVLATLGFFSAFESLALNLVLAAEAMVLLIIAHQTRLRLFHLLSQAVLLANFLHYWVYASTIDPTRARFFGGMLTAAVYLVKSALEEEWYRPGSAFSWKKIQPRSAFLKELSDAFDRVYSLLTPFLAHLHAIGGALILVDQCRRFLGVAEGGVVLAVGTIGFAALGAWRRSIPLLIASSSIYAGTLAILVFGGGASSELAGTARLAIILGAGSLASAMALTFSAFLMRRNSFQYGLCLWPGFTLLLFLLGFGLGRTDAFETPAPFMIWIASMLIGLFALERFSFLTGLNVQATHAMRTMFILLETLVGTLLASCLFSILHSYFKGAPLQFVVISGFASILPLIAVIRRTPGVYAAGLALMVFLFLRICTSTPERESLFASIPATLATSLPLMALAWTQDLLARLFGELLARIRGSWVFVGIALPYALGMFFLFGLLDRSLAAPWSYAGFAMLSGLLMSLTQPWKLFRGAMVSIPFFGISAFIYIGEHAGKHPENWDYVWGALAVLITGLAMERIWSFQKVSLNQQFRSLGSSTAIRPDSIGRVALLICFSGVALTSGWNSALIGPQWTTAAWAIYAALLMVMGFGYRLASFRRCALGILALCTARVLLVDIRNLETVYQAFALLVLGLCLVAIAWLYSRFSTQLRQWL